MPPIFLTEADRGVLQQVFNPAEAQVKGSQDDADVAGIAQTDLDDIEARISAAITADPLCLAVAEFVYESILSSGLIGDVVDLGAGNDTMEARSGNDIVFGGDGDDEIDGGEGIDLLLGEGGNDLLSGAGGDDGLFGGAGNDQLNGGDGIDYLCGGTGNDVLDGGAGADFMAGGAGSDLYHVDDAGDFIFEGATEGDHDGIIWEVADDLDLSTYDNIEHAKIAGLGHFDIAGTSANNILLGNDGKNVLAGLGGSDSLAGEGETDTLLGGDGIDVLRGGAGADSLSGGAEIDFADYTDSDAGVDVDLNLSGGQSGGYALGDTLEDIEHLIGSLYDDSLTGDDGNNSLFGDPTTTPEGLVGPGDVMDGDDVLDGRGGNDILLGRFGDDTIHGGDGEDSIVGGEGDDIIVGEDGADVIRGGDGVDYSSYWNSDAAVSVSLTTGVGIGGHAEGDNLAEIEILEGSSFDDLLVGDANDNQLYGRHGDDTLVGGDGDDSLNGLAGDDELHGGDGLDTLIGDDGADTLFGYTGNDQLSGGDGDDELYGGSGDDYLNGWADNDELDGGAGADTVIGGTGSDLLFGGDGGDNDEILAGDTVSGSDGTRDIVTAAATFAENGTDTIFGLEENVTIEKQDLIDFSDAIDLDNDTIDNDEELLDHLWFDKSTGGLFDTGADGSAGTVDDNLWFQVYEDNDTNVAETPQVRVDGQDFLWSTDQWIFAPT